MKIFSLLFLLFLGIFSSSNIIHAQHKLDFFSPDFQEIWVDEFDYADYIEIRDSGEYTLDDTRCGQRMDFTWADLSFETDNTGNSIMVQTATVITQPCVEDTSIGLDCTCIKANGDIQPYLYRTGGIVGDISLNDPSDQVDIDAVNCITQSRYVGVYTGLIEARVKWFAQPNSWPNFWLYNGQTEIDIAEGRAAGGTPTTVSNQISSSLLDLDNNHEGPIPETSFSVKTTFERDMSANFHLFSCLWTYDPVSEDHTFTFFVDGRELLTRTDFPAWDCPVSIRFNSKVHEAADFPFNGAPVEYRVDYVKVKKFIGNTTRYYAYTNYDLAGGAKTVQPAKALGVGSNDALFYRRNNDQMGFRYQLPNSQGSYSHILDNLVSNSSASTLVGGDLIVTTSGSGENKVYYRGQDGLLRTYWYNGQWNQATLDFAPKGKKNPVSSECGGLTGNEDDGIFYRGTDDMLHHFFWDPNDPQAYSNGWVHETIGSSGPNDSWLIAGDVELAPNGHVYYRGKNNRLQQYYRSTEGIWSHANVDISGVEENKVSDACGSIAVSNTSIFYRGKDDLMHRMFFDPNFQPSNYPGAMTNDWVYETLPFDNYDPQLVNGDIEVPSMIDPKEVYYRGSDSEVQKYTYYDGHWYHAWVDDGDGIFAPTNIFDLPVYSKGTLEIGPSGNIFFINNVTTDARINRYTKVNLTTGDMLNLPNDSVNVVRLTDNQNYGESTTTSKDQVLTNSSSNDDSSSAIIVSPNPSSGLFTVTSPVLLSGSIIVKTALGQTMSSTKVENLSSLEIDGSAWPPGVYLLTYLEGGKLNLVRKIIKN